jgi:hypothetical protein
MVLRWERVEAGLRNTAGGVTGEKKEVDGRLMMLRRMPYIY